MLEFTIEHSESSSENIDSPIYMYIDISSFFFVCLVFFSFCFGLFCFVVSSLETISARLFNVRKKSKCDKMRNKVKL